MPAVTVAFARRPSAEMPMITFVVAIHVRFFDDLFVTNGTANREGIVLKTNIQNIARIP